MRILALGLLILGLAGCSFAPEYQRPLMPMPETWKGEVGQGERLDLQWWRRFDDATLNALVEEALTYNRDIAAAVARVDTARARLGVARAELFPLINAEAQGTQTWIDNTKVTAGTEAPFSAGFGATWELDLWGRLRNAREAARYQLLASEAAQRGVQLSVAGQTANAYFLLLSLDSQQATAERTVKTREDALAIYTARYEQGLINELDLSRAKTEVETAKTALYQTRISRDAAESALAVLVGRSPREIMNGTMPRGLPLEAIPTPPVIPVGVPSDLLERRPDIRQAERTVEASNANIGVARAAWFPTISLTGLFGVVSPELHSLMSNPLQTWSYGGSATMPLIDFGRVGYNVEAAEGQQREALAAYEKTVQTAFQDMRDALTRQAEMSNVVASLERTVKELRLSVDLARLRYDNGYSSYLEVLDAERSLFDSELQLASARSERLTSIVNVCLALGGGWM